MGYALEVAKTRFPTLAELAREQIADIHGEEALQRIQVEMYAAETEQQAEISLH